MKNDMETRSISNTSLVEGLRERIALAATEKSVGIISPGSNYNDILDAISSYMKSKSMDVWVYVNISNPFERIVEERKELLSISNIRFIDCISRASGLNTVDNRCIFIESPTHL